MRHNVRSAALIAMVVLGLVGSACSSSSGTKAASSSSSPTTPCAGQPMKLAVISSETGPIVVAAADAAKAAVKAANDTCEAGRPIALSTCDDRGDANTSSDCARKAINADSSAAIVLSVVEENTDDLLSKAGIPIITSGSSPAALTSSVSFPIVGGLPIFLAGPSVAKALGAKSVAMVGFDAPAFTGLAAAAEAKASAAGLKVGPRVLIPPDATDLAQYAAQAARNDAIQVGLTSRLFEQFLRALVDQGTDLKKLTVVAPLDLLDPSTIDALGSKIDGVVLVSQSWPVTDKTNAGIAQYVKESKAFSPDAKVGASGIGTWASIHIVAQVAKKLAAVDTKSLAAALNGLHQTRPEIAPFTWGTNAMPDDPLFGKLRIPSRHVSVSEIISGKITPLAPNFVDPNEPLNLEHP